MVGKVKPNLLSNENGDHDVEEDPQEEAAEDDGDDDQFGEEEDCSG